VSSRGRIVRVPASTANLGPGYDVLGAALTFQL
jgi:homoserine kinase